METLNIIIDCHPNEHVGREVALLVASLLHSRGRSVRISQMPLIIRTAGDKNLFWYEYFATPNGLGNRSMEETNFARRNPNVQTVSFHDGPLVQFEETGYITKFNGIPNFACVEVDATLRKVNDLHRLKVGQGAETLLDEFDLQYITHDSDLELARSLGRFSPSFIDLIARLIEESKEIKNSWTKNFEGRVTTINDYLIPDNRNKAS